MVKWKLKPMIGVSSINIIALIHDDLNAVNANKLLVILSNRGFHALLFYRISNLCWRKRIPILPLILTRFIQILYSIDIDYRAEIGGGCLITHGTCLVIGSGVKIGKNVRLYHGVTIGFAEGGKHDGYPNVGDNVFIGAGAKILGNVFLGNGSKVGANSVVLNNVPDYGLAVGIPAQIKQKNYAQAI